MLQNQEINVGDSILGDSSITATISSKPEEIICALDAYSGNDSVISLPFSMDGMERAKRKILSQAAKIRELEAQLQRKPTKSNETCRSNHRPKQHTGDPTKKTEQPQSFKAVLSPEERLQAHKERKRGENRYKEESGKWGKPPPLQRQSLLSKVKKKEDLVDRLVADPKERKRHDEVKRTVTKTLKKYAMSCDDDLHTSLNKMSNRKKPFVSREYKSKKREALMQRLNMDVKDRRSLKHNDVPRNLKRTLDGHTLDKKVWIMAEEYGCSEEDSSSNHSSRQNIGNVYQVESEGLEDENVCCYTCQSSDGCEEDVDNPGIFYCAQCWDEYEKGPQLVIPYDYGTETASMASNSGTCSVDGNPTARAEGTRLTLEGESEKDSALWIIHDDPKLGVRLVCSGPKRMSCLIETKQLDGSNCVRIMIGSINYCGPVVRSGWRGTFVKETRRGAECIRMGNVFGYIINHNEVETRLAKGKSVYEFRLDPNSGIPLTGRNAHMSMKDFLQDYVGAVDVILDPQCSPGGWYPQREANSSSSFKIAPQFRSKGVGYIRLGDDMGGNGLAFLSSDSCKSFFSTKSVELDEGNCVGSFMFDSSTNNDLGVDEEVSSYTSGSSTAGTQSPQESAFDLIKQIESLDVSKEMKWNDRADLLVRIGKAVGESTDQNSCSAALKTVQDVISSKNMNVHVLRSALITVGRIGGVMKKDLCNDISWKTIMIEMLKLLKNKQVSGTAKETLNHLHGRCYTLGNSLTSISHILGFGKSGQLRKRKSFHQTNTRKTIGTPLTKVASSGSVNSEIQKANNVELIQWLAETTEIERAMDDIEPMIDKSGLSLIADCFLSHESHRDARCRKNALDGLLHTMVYGIDRIDLTIREAQSLCLELKSTNSRSWSRLMKSVYSIIEEEHIELPDS